MRVKPRKSSKSLGECDHTKMSGMPTNIGRELDRRLLWLAFAAVMIVGLCVLKLARRYPAQSSIPVRPGARPAPGIELYDQSSPSQIVRLEAFLGRERVFVIFFDGQAGAHSSTTLSYLRENWNRLRRANIHVIAISTALPQENRKDISQYGAFPFALLSDPDLHVHQAWGRFDVKRAKPLFGLFFVDRKGWVAASAESSVPTVTEDWKSVVNDQISSHAI
jgi:peroxiredoxin